LTLRIRTAKEADMPFIVDSWKRSYEGAPAVRGADRDHYRIEMSRTIRRICDRATVRVACDPEDESTLVGFAAYLQNTDSSATLCYCYVKKDFRGMGIARDLLKGVPITAYAFLSNNARPREGWRYCPRFTIDAA